MHLTVAFRRHMINAERPVVRRAVAAFCGMGAGLNGYLKGFAMNGLHRACVTDPGACDFVRRGVLAGLAGASAASLIPWALAQPVADAEQGPFVALSAILVGRSALDGSAAKRLYGALVADDANFAAATKALLALINERKIDPLQLQQVLDQEKSPLAALPRAIVSAWLLGVVGGGEKARCLAFETALNAVMVADMLKPPTYAYGVYGSWARPPG